MKCKEAQKGFTFVELLVTMVVGFMVLALAFDFIDNSTYMVRKSEAAMDAQQLGIGAMDYVEKVIRFGESTTLSAPITTPTVWCKATSPSEGIELYYNGDPTNKSMLQRSYFHPYKVGMLFNDVTTTSSKYNLLETTLTLYKDTEEIYKLTRIIELINTEDLNPASPGVPTDNIYVIYQSP